MVRLYASSSERRVFGLGSWGSEAVLGKVGFYFSRNYIYLFGLLYW